MTTLIDLLRHPTTPQPDSSGNSPLPSHFWAEGRFPVEHLAVDVEGLGRLSQPLQAVDAAALHGVSEPARFGLRDKTLLDAAVRHTGEISADLISLAWQPDAFDALKRTVAQALGVTRLDAWLHNLLIYGPDQFFKPHQDTEKHPGMVATLVLIWPSPHIGGTLRVQLGQQSGELVSQHLQAPDLRWFAFYADCRHEVLPVQEGWRVALTFDLVLPAEDSRPDVPAALQAQLQDLLQQHFALESNMPSLRPRVLFLDHEYTEHGLRWPLLKGDDRWRVAALQAAAEALGLSMHLALAELHETWTAQPTERSRSSRYRNDDSAEPDELIEETLTLDFLVDAQNRVTAGVHWNVNLDDTECFTETDDEHLTNEEYEGYMGNYGETLDYWYRRAALVIQVPLAAERNRFQLDFPAALADAQRLARDPAAVTTLATRVHAAAGLLKDRVSRDGRTLLAAYAEIAIALPDPDAATALMLAFDPRTFLPEDARAVAALQNHRGEAWTLNLMRAWHDPLPDQTPRLFASWPALSTSLSSPRLWPATLPAFTQAARNAGWSPALLSCLLAASLFALTQFDKARTKATPATRLQLLDSSLQAAAELAQALQQHGEDGKEDLRALVDHVIARPALYPTERLAPLIASVGPLADQWPREQSLRMRVITALRTALAAPERAPSDHRLHTIEWTCRCKDCADMITWAESPTAQPLTMPMAEPRRDHVQAQFTAAGARLTASVLKQGSPHKLILQKPGNLHARERATREGWARDLAAVESI